MIKSFLPIIIYKVLKQTSHTTNQPLLFLTHHNLQGSQTNKSVVISKSLFLTHHNLQGSQTIRGYVSLQESFLTHHNLQGSQTKR